MKIAAASRGWTAGLAEGSGDPGVRIEPGRFLIGGARTDLVSGEVHYWRLNSLFWKDVLGMVREAGFQIVSTYVPYVHHEHEEGKFDFTGSTHPSRDLVGFLGLCADAGLKVLIRPGPVIAAEWRNLGLPDHVMRDPALRISTGVYRLQEEFLEKLERYFDSLCAAVCPLQFPNGPIVAWQIDNELGGPGCIPAEGQAGLETGMYRDFLEERYGSVEALNRAYGTAFADVSEIPYPRSPKEIPVRQAIDMYAFGDRFVMEVVKTYREKLEARKARVPFFVNFTVTPSRDWAACQRHADFMGVDMYLHDLIPWEEHLFFSRTIKHLSAVTALPWSPEFQSGIWPYLYDKHGRGVTSRHIRYMTMVAVATGLKGFNYYMLVNRDNWFMSPIDDVGTPMSVAYPEKRKSLAELMRAVKLIRDNSLLSLDRRAGVALVWYRPHYLREALERTVTVPEGLAYEELEKPCRFDYPEFWDLFRALSEADIDFDLVDPEHAGPGALARYGALLYGGKREMAADVQEMLAGYVKTGGKLIAHGELPVEDLRGGGCEILSSLGKTGGFITAGSPGEAIRILESNGLDLGTRSGIPRVLTYLHAGPDRRLLYVVNSHAMEQAPSIPELRGSTDLETGERVTGERVYIPGKDVKVFGLADPGGTR